MNPSQEETSNKAPLYDYLKLYAVIEFGMNESREHIQDDIERLCHPDANLVHSFIVHLYRLSKSGNLFSGRDWSSKSHQIMAAEDIRLLLDGMPVELYLGVYDSTGTHSSGVWNIKDGQVVSVK